MRETTRLSYWVVAVVLGGCTTVVSDNDPFSTANPVTSMTPGTDSGEAETEEAQTEGSGEAESTGGGDTTSGGSATTTGPMGTTTNTSMGDTTTTGGGGGVQPGMGQYSECTIPEDCGFAPNLCFTITEEGGGLIGGFCTIQGCAGPGDCDPSPVPTATAACVPATINMMADMACVLQCPGMAACPAPMECISVTGFGEICV